MIEIANLHPKRILVCQLRQIGDVLLSTPSIRLLSERYPDAEIDVLTEKQCVPVLENNPRVNHIWSINKKALSNPFKALAYYAKVGRSQYDIVIDFQQLPRCRWVVLFSNAPVKLTFPPPWYNKFLYTHWSHPLKGYAVKAKASVLNPLGINWDGEKPEIWLTEEERQFAKTFTSEHKLDGTNFITVDPSHRRETRRWPARHFTKLIQLLRQKHPKLKALVLYGPGEKDLALKVAAEAGEGALTPDKMLSLREMAAVQSLACMHLGNCSSPRHFAVAVDTPTFIIHGSTTKAWRYPSDEHVSAIRKDPCRVGCNQNTCKFGTIDCLHKYLPEDVLENALTVLELGIRKKNQQ